MADSPLVDATGPLGVSIKLDGQQIGDDVQIVSVRIHHALNRIPDAVFVIKSTTALLDDFTELDSSDFALGKAVEIAGFYGDGDEQRLFTGIITAYRLRAEHNAGVRLEVTCRDKALALTEARASMGYIDQKDSDVMRAIVEAAALTAEITATTSTAPLVLRVASAGWDYLRLLADRNGHVLIVDEAKITSKPIDMTTAPVLTLTFGMDIVDVDITVDAQRMIGSASASAWNAQTQRAVTGQDNTLTDLQLGNTRMSGIADVLERRPSVTTTTRDFEQADLTTFSKTRMMRAGVATVRGSVSFQGTGKIWPGDMLEITGTGERFGGKGHVTAVEHELEAGVWSTTARLGLPQDWTTDAAGGAAPAAQSLNAPIHGLQIGKVLQVAEDDTGQQRIKIKLPMISDPPVQVWARYTTPYASNQIGFQFLPEVDDEVVVAFLDANPEAPVIVGSLHNGQAKRPVEAENANSIKTIVTREKIKLTFDEEKKSLTAETPGERRLCLDDDAASITIEDADGNSIVMDSSGITIKTSGDITMTATGNITAEATGDATVNGANVTCEGQVGFTGKGGGTAELSSGGMTKVEGSLVNIN
jgi:Rhs element Vgr protein